MISSELRCWGVLARSLQNQDRCVEAEERFEKESSASVWSSDDHLMITWWSHDHFFIVRFTYIYQFQTEERVKHTYLSIKWWTNLLVKY
jgi:hypothetical protein